MMYYKWLKDDGKWPLPTQNEDGTWTPGEWTPYVEKLKKSGYRVCTGDAKSLLEASCYGTLYEVAFEGETKVFDYRTKVIGHRARLIHKIGEMDERKWILFACDCAERAVHIYENKCPNENSMCLAIETARHYANGDALKEELSNALSSALSAVWPSAWDRWTISRAVVWPDLRDARVIAVHISHFAIDVAGDAPSDVSWDAAVAAERKWQAERLLQYVRGER